MIILVKSDATAATAALQYLKPLIDIHLCIYMYIVLKLKAESANLSIREKPRSCTRKADNNTRGSKILAL